MMEVSGIPTLGSSGTGQLEGDDDIFADSADEAVRPHEIPPEAAPKIEAVRRVAKLAAVDIGSNSIHMLMVELLPHFAYRVLGRDKEMVRLGKGGYRRRRLTDEAMDSAVAALSRFQKLALAKGIEHFRLAATSAVREAVNGGDFIERVRSQLGLKIKVISGIEEGRLVFLALQHGVDFGGDTVLGIDLGGGSLELAVGTQDQAPIVESFKLGAGRMYELFLPGDPPSAEDLYAMEQHIRVTLDPARDLFHDHKIDRAIATSGTAITLAHMCARAASGKDAETFREPRLDREILADIYKKMSRRPMEQRAKMPGMDPRRADQIVAGTAVLLGVMNAFDLKEMSISEQSVRDGIVLNYINRHRRGLLARQAYPDPRLRTVLHLAERCGWHQAHAEQVARLAVSMFEQLRSIHELPDEPWLELLRYAGMLHDIGYLIGQEKHHKHAEYLIRNGGLMGFTDEDVGVVALSARYHRGGEPKPGKLDELPKAARRAVKVFASLLRIAEALDRSHFNVVDGVTVRIEPARVVLDVHTSGDAELEIWTAQRRKEMFENVLGKPLVIEHAPAGK